MAALEEVVAAMVEGTSNGGRFSIIMLKQKSRQ